MAAVTSPGPHKPLSSGGASSPVRRAAPAAVDEPPADQQLVAEMRQEISALVAEVTGLAGEDIEPADFYSGFMPRVVAAMAAHGGAVWSRSASGQLELAHQINLAQCGLDAAPASAQHGQLLRAALEGGQSIAVAPHSSQGERGAGNPTPHLLILGPLLVENEPVGLVEIFQRGGAAPSTQRGYLRFVSQMCELASGYLKNRRLRQLAENQTLWRELESFLAAIHQSLDVRTTSYTVVNDGRRLIGCDRVSLALRSGGHCQIVAVSGLDSIDRRAAEVQSLAQLAEAVIRTGEPLASDSSRENVPPQIQQPLDEYVDRSHARHVVVLPLRPPQAADGQLPLGALIVEQFRELRLAETVRARAGIVAQHSAAALANATEHSSLFLLPLWRALGQATWLFRGRALPKTLLAIGLVIVTAYGLAAVQTDFVVSAHGKLQPAERRDVFAPLDGIVAGVHVEHGQVVAPGECLAELTSTDLDLQLAGLIGRQTTNQERQTALSRALLDNKGGSARLAPAEENRLAGEMLQLQQEAASIEQELALVRQKQQQLRITAREPGRVVTWKVRDLLLQRPVIRGQSLLTIANTEGPWELELYLPERRVVHVQRAADEPLTATFVLASHPGQVFKGQVVEIEQSAEVRGDEGNTVLVRVAVDRRQLPPLHDQTTVTAKLRCGRASLGYAWFCDLIETVHTNILFWLPSSSPQPTSFSPQPQA